jgi:hypothetical protein
VRKTVVSLFPIAFVLGATIVPGPGAQAAPTAITTCQTISESGSYVLANNISTTGDCLMITASDVTIDLAGFHIASRGTAIEASINTNSIAVRNGSISVSGFGVSLPGDGSIVEGLRIASAGLRSEGIVAKGIVRGNTVLGGVFPMQSGIIASGTVTDNYVSGVVQGIGIRADGTVRGNTAIDNTRGIMVGVGSTVIGNTATNKSVSGIQASCPTNLTDNTAVNNGTNLVLNGDGCNKTNNVVP